MAGAIETFIKRHYAKRADEPVPVLGGQTPRQAIKSAAGLERVKGLLRSYQDGESQQAAQQGRREISYQFLWDEMELARQPGHSRGCERRRESAVQVDLWSPVPRSLGRFLFAEKIGVRAGSFKANHFAVYAVNQDPVWFNMQVATWFPFAIERVVVQFTWQGLTSQ